VNGFAQMYNKTDMY